MRIVAHVTLFTWPAKVLMAEGTLTAEADPCVPGSGSFSDLKLRDWLNRYTDSN